MPATTAPRTTIVQRVPARAIQAAPRPRPRTVIVQQGAQVARRVGSAAARAAAEEKHTLVAGGVALAVGWADSRGMLESVPELVPGTGAVGTLAIAAWGLGKFTGSRMARHAATGLISIALFRVGAGQSST